MSTYLAFPDGFQKWLDKQPNSEGYLCSTVLPASTEDLLGTAVHAVDTFRATRSQNGQLLVFWNTDYLDSSGAPAWAFVALDEDFGIGRVADYSSEILRRAIALVRFRLNKRHVPGHWRLRQHNGNFKTCIAGGPTQISRHSLAFWEGETRLGESRRFALLCVGPDDGPVSNKPTVEQERAVAQCERRVAEIATLITLADQTIVEAAGKAACNLSIFREFERSVQARQIAEGPKNPVTDLPPLESPDAESTYSSRGLTYYDWIAPGSSLGKAQRKILESDVMSRQPLRIIGPAGSGKTLLMQLLCIHYLKRAKDTEAACRCLYVCHNAAMQNFLSTRFEELGATEFLIGDQQVLEVSTLAQYCSLHLQVTDLEVVDNDAAETKAFQTAVIRESLEKKLYGIDWSTADMPLIRTIAERQGLINIFVELIIHEIGISIKGHSLVHDKQEYVDSMVPLSRLHGGINQDERRFVYEVFEDYYRQTTEEQGVMDADDLAITLLSKLRSPLWNIRRKAEGVDLLFVDETQLFNENERRLFAYLPKRPSHTGHLPIALALDEAQELKGAVSSGFGTLGIESIVNEHLDSIYRCTPSILRLAFFVIQHTTDLFGVDFPDFTLNAKSLISDEHPSAAKPSLRIGGTATGLGNYIAKRAHAIRSENLRSVCIVVHADKYWDDAWEAVKNVSGSEPYVLKRRGDVFGVDRPGIVLTPPEYVGGQEFDAVISVGLEDGIVPPNVTPESFAESLKQRALREMYLVFTRARYRLEVVISVNASVTSVLEPAVCAGLLVKAG